MSEVVSLISTTAASSGSAKPIMVSECSHPTAATRNDFSSALSALAAQPPQEVKARKLPAVKSIVIAVEVPRQSLESFSYLEGTLRR